MNNKIDETVEDIFGEHTGYLAQKMSQMPAEAQSVYALEVAAGELTEKARSVLEMFEVSDEAVERIEELLDGLIGFTGT